MLLVLLPTTNIYGALVGSGGGSAPQQTTPQYSSNYYLNKIKQKTKHIDYQPFINCYRDLCKNQVTSNSFFIFFELINNFDFFTESIKLYRLEKDYSSGIIEAFNHINKNHQIEVIDDDYKTTTTTTTTTTTILPQQHFSVDLINREKNGSHLIVIIEDCFDEETIKLLYFLSSKYDKVFVTKPISCWAGSSTKYVVCKNNKGCSVSLGNPTNIFLTKIEELNCIFVEEQIEGLMTVFNKQDRINLILNNYNQKCITWFIKHQIDYK
jgi:hypothetical protein